MVSNKKIDVLFFRSATGEEPVRSWLKALKKTDKKIIGEDIKTVQFGWPTGMPLVRHIKEGIWEVRSKLTSNKIARVFFFMEDNTMILIHGFIKKHNKHL